MTWDTVAAAYLTTGTSKWDATAKTVTFAISVDCLVGKKVFGPYTLYASVAYGAVVTEAQGDGRAPNPGDLLIG